VLWFLCFLLTDCDWLYLLYVKCVRSTYVNKRLLTYFIEKLAANDQKTESASETWTSSRIHETFSIMTRLDWIHITVRASCRTVNIEISSWRTSSTLAVIICRIHWQFSSIRKIIKITCVCVSVCLPVHKTSCYCYKIVFKLTVYAQYTYILSIVGL